MNRRTVLAVGGVLAAAALAAIFIGYGRSPKYSLLQIKKAVEQHDSELLLKYLDVDAISGQVTDFLVARMPVNKELEQPLVDAIHMGKDLLRPQVTSFVRREAIAIVERGSFEDEYLGERGIVQNPNSWLANFVRSELLLPTQQNDFRDVSFVRREGKIAYVGLVLSQERYQTTSEVLLRLRKKGGHWQVSGIVNLGSFFAEISQRENDRTEELNRGVMEEHAGTLVVERSWKEKYNPPRRVQIIGRCSSCGLPMVVIQ